MRRLASRAPRAFVGSLILAALFGACAPPCEQVCRKVRKCDVSPRLSQDECEEACDRQKTFYEVEEDKDGREAFAAERRCIASASCDEILAGECYDPEVFPF